MLTIIFRVELVISHWAKNIMWKENISKINRVEVILTIRIVVLEQMTDQGIGGLGEQRSSVCIDRILVKELVDIYTRFL